MGIASTFIMIRRSLAIVLLLIAATVVAELSPEVYRDLQRKSPEVLHIQVSAVDIHRRFAKPAGCEFFDFEVIREVRVEARVLRVVRSESRIRAGDVIAIAYSSINRCSGWSGPRSMTVLRNGDRVYAFLVRRGSSFEPAARGATFTASP
jgi:hypothetical protein